MPRFPQSILPDPETQFLAGVEFAYQLPLRQGVVDSQHLGGSPAVNSSFWRGAVLQRHKDDSNQVAHLACPDIPG